MTPPQPPTPPAANPPPDLSLDKAISEYDTYSSKASDNVRTLALSAVAAIWVLSDQTVGGLRGSTLWLSFCLVVLALFFDFLQYVLSANIFGFYLIRHERKNTAADVAGVQRPAKVVFGTHARLPGKLMYHAKIITLLAAYGFLGWALVNRLWPSA